MTSLTRIRVKSSLPSEENAVRRELERLAGIPYFLISWPWVENRLTLSGSVRRIDHSGNPFGRAVLTLVPEVPVAKIGQPDDLKGLAIDRMGRIFATDVETPQKVEIELPKRAADPSMSLGQPWESEIAADLATFLAASYPDRSWLIVMGEDSSFGIRDGSKSMRLGSIASVEDVIPSIVDTFGDPAPSQGSPTGEDKP